jgi:hypothetical protein
LPHLDLKCLRLFGGYNGIFLVPLMRHRIAHRQIRAPSA